MDEGKDQEEKGDDDEDHAAGFGAKHAAGEPIGSRPGCSEEVTDAEFAGVTSGIEEHGCPIEGGVEADYEGKRTGAANRQAAEETE